MLVSPTVHENLSANVSDGRQRNDQLKLYTKAMAEAAWRHNLLLLDLFAPTRQVIDSDSDRTLTLKGIHPTEYG